MTDEKDRTTEADTVDTNKQKDAVEVNQIDNSTDKNNDDKPENKTNIKEPEIQEKTEKTRIDKTKERKDKDEGTKRKEKLEDENFHYIVRIANTDLDGHKQVIYALTQIKGIGRRMAIFIADSTNVDRYIEIGKLSDEQIEKLKNTIDNLSTLTPSWMMNHRLDYDTGHNLHFISNDVTARLRDDINFMKMIRCYKGVRHELGLPVRGQRTRSNGRKGLALGVSRKAAAQKPATSQTSEKSKQSKKE
ncbi:MAG: 30S ribosomal protein S13 [Candidatus Thermoplasmatota archaeon]